MKKYPRPSKSKKQGISKLQRYLLVSAIVFSLYLIFVFVADWYTSPKTEVPSRAAKVAETHQPTPRELIKLVNIERKVKGVLPLQIDSRLNASAQEKANDMVKNGYYAHSNPKTGKQGYSIARDHMPECLLVSENIGESITSELAVLSWTESKSHYDAMIDPRYTKTGFGVAKNERGYYYFVEHFCIA